jgi:pentose-5-phosphate-3-epimerase
MNSAAVIKQECHDDLRRATRTVAKKVEKCIEVDGGIFENLL